MELYTRIISAEPVPLKAGEWQGDIATEYAAACLHAAKEYSAVAYGLEEVIC